MNVLDALHLAGLRRGAADALVEAHPDAGGTTLKRPKHQLAIDVAVKADPVHIRQRFVDQRSGVRHVGDRVRLTRHKSFERRGEVAVHRCLVVGVDLEVEHQSNVTFPRVCFTALR